MTTLYDNFFFHPADTFGITAGYTVPAGHYARIYPNSPYAFVDDEEIFLGLGYTVVLNSQYKNLSPSFSGKVSTNTVNATKDLENYSFDQTSATGNVVSKTFLARATGTAALVVYVLDGSLARVIGSASFGGNATASTGGVGLRVFGTSNANFTVRPFTPHYVFVKEGTVLEGDFTVELFKNPLGV